MYDVLVQKKVIRRIEKMPESIQDRMADLWGDLKDSVHFSRFGQTMEGLDRAVIIAIYLRSAEKVITCFPAVFCDRKWRGGLQGKGAKCSKSLADR